MGGEQDTPAHLVAHEPQRPVEFGIVELQVGDEVGGVLRPE